MQLPQQRLQCSSAAAACWHRRQQRWRQRVQRSHHSALQTRGESMIWGRRLVLQYATAHRTDTDADQLLQ